MRKGAAQSGFLVAAAVGFTLLGGCVTSIGASELIGRPRNVTIDCDRPSASCTVRGGPERTLPLASMKDAVVVCKRRHIGTSSSERQCAIQTGDVTLDNWSGDAKSESEYRAVVSQIQTFASESAATAYGGSPTAEVPALHADYAVRETAKAATNTLVTGIFGLLVGLGLGWIVLSARRPSGPTSDEV